MTGRPMTRAELEKYHGHIQWGEPWPVKYQPVYEDETEGPWVAGFVCRICCARLGLSVLDIVADPTRVFATAELAQKHIDGCGRES